MNLIVLCSLYILIQQSNGVLVSEKHIKLVQNIGDFVILKDSVGVCACFYVN